MAKGIEQSPTQRRHAQRSRSKGHSVPAQRTHGQGSCSKEKVKQELGSEGLLVWNEGWRKKEAQPVEKL